MQGTDILYKLMPFWSEDERILRIFNLTQIGTNQIVLDRIKNLVIHCVKHGQNQHLNNKIKFSLNLLFILTFSYDS